MTTDISDINIRVGLGERLSPDEFHAKARDDADRAIRRLLADYGNAKDPALTLRRALVDLMVDYAGYRSAPYRKQCALEDRLVVLEAAASPRLRGVA